ncbi:MAG: NAD(P)-dependent glycerol-3-phosphate dehydrogenase [Spirochaetales bacterium]|nr:NAD(P)-dependent glycerol-3-phosphate dehydrogenase [Spirochaetales bacterium]
MGPEKQRKICILGAGAWGTAMAKVIAEKGFPVEIWCFEKEVAEQINREKVNSRYLMGVQLPPNIRATTDIQKAVTGKEYLLFAVPSLYIVEITKRILQIPDIIEGRMQIGILTKGFIKTHAGTLLITEALENYLPGFYKGNLTYISGPSHAEEVARGKITGLISASSNGVNSIKFRELLSGGKLIVFSSFDVIGVQVSAGLKNVIAIAFGVLDALKELSQDFGDNTESLLLAAGLNEIQILGQAMGATHQETFTSIAGVGDLDVTCRSIYGRNRRLGREIIFQRRLSSYKNIEEVIDDINSFGYFPEGILAAQRVHDLVRERKLKLPISTGVYRILDCQVKPMQEVERILKGITRGTGFGTLESKKTGIWPSIL